MVNRKEGRRKPRGNEARFDLRNDLYRIFGVDLTDVPGVSSLTAHLLLTEVGADLSNDSVAGAEVTLAADWIRRAACRMRHLCRGLRLAGDSELNDG
jgi:hypothetical protein